MNIADFDLYQDLLRRKAGIELTADKSYLLDSHLTPVSKQWGFPSLEVMTMALRGMPDSKLVQDIIEAMAVHDTHFFMDTKQFKFFEKTVMPHLLKDRRHKRLRFWCPACSTGQEAYSLALALREMSPDMAGWTVEIQGTDVSRKVLAQAEKGIYRQIDVQRGMPSPLLVKYFDREVDGHWTLRNEIRRMVAFRHFNLLDNMVSLGQFDAIFCRNVLNSFDKKTARQVLESLAARLTPQGFLFLDESETLPEPLDPLTPVDGISGLFILKDNGLRKASA
jgi:chemotaxis protein methyltransferase CheR